MKKFQVVDHKADIRVRIFGGDIEELLANSILALRRISEPETMKGDAVADMEVSSIDLSSLLVDLLNEVLFLSRTRSESYSDIEFFEISDTSIKGRLKGSKVKGFGEDIKAATYHGVEVKEGKEGLEATVIFDI